VWARCAAPINVITLSIYNTHARANEWAWQNRRWESIQQFRDTQRVWVIWGIFLVAMSVVLGIILAAVAAALALHATR
jgi:hypothetical protein